jgi:hypothetical protein
MISERRNIYYYYIVISLIIYVNNAISSVAPVYIKSNSFQTGTSL